MTRSGPRLLATLMHRGIQLAAVGGRLRYRPQEAVDAGLKADLVRHKADLVALVQCMAVPPLAAGIWAKCASALLARIPNDNSRAALREAFEERAAICEYDGNLGPGRCGAGRLRAAE